MSGPPIPEHGPSAPPIVCVASVSVWFRSKERPVLAAREMKREPFTYTIFAQSLTLVPCSLLLNRTETLAAQATPPKEVRQSDKS